MGSSARSMGAYVKERLGMMGRGRARPQMNSAPVIKRNRKSTVVTENGKKFRVSAADPARATFAFVWGEESLGAGFHCHVHGWCVTVAVAVDHIPRGGVSLCLDRVLLQLVEWRADLHVHIKETPTPESYSPTR